MIVKIEPEDSPMRSMVLRPGPFHTEMSFPGCMGRLMEGSGFCPQGLQCLAIRPSAVHTAIDSAGPNIPGGDINEDRVGGLSLFDKLVNGELAVQDCVLVTSLVSILKTGKENRTDESPHGYPMVTVHEHGTPSTTFHQSREVGKMESASSYSV
ncbi:hypothetical protein ElyMa_001292000 [Elysia marginata]|uniref:Uncharacterized protein n=1 Tax=Elysia marginata TaxID=1093978 RepID=A0AAV4IK23_9GAST|nr:hypothetical protein ElyMa_001292000 [Elysia marginata]